MQIDVVNKSSATDSPDDLENQPRRFRDAVNDPTDANNGPDFHYVVLGLLLPCRRFARNTHNVSG